MENLRRYFLANRDINAWFFAIIDIAANSKIATKGSAQ